MTPGERAMVAELRRWRESCARWAADPSFSDEERREWRAAERTLAEALGGDLMAVCPLVKGLAPERE